MLAFMDICMGGRVAEEIVYGAENVTSGRTCTPSLPLHCDAFFFSVTTSSYTLCSPTHSLHSHSTPSPSTSSPLHTHPTHTHSLLHTGASSDIQQATRTAKMMVTKWGMSDKVGLFYVDEKDKQSAEFQELIDTEVPRTTLSCVLSHCIA